MHIHTARSPVGSGPFRFSRWEARSVVEVVADTGYHLGRPLLDRVIWMLNPDPPRHWSSVLAGEVDVFETVTPDAMAQDRRPERGTGRCPIASPNYGYLGFNFRDSKNPERPHPLFGDRQAASGARDGDRPTGCC